AVCPCKLAVEPGTCGSLRMSITWSSCVATYVHRGRGSVPARGTHESPPFRRRQPFNRIAQRRPRHGRGMVFEELAEHVRAHALADFSKHPADRLLNEIV